MHLQVENWHGWMGKLCLIKVGISRELCAYNQLVPRIHPAKLHDETVVDAVVSTSQVTQNIDPFIHATAGGARHL